MNSAYTVHNSKICPSKSTNAGKKKKKKGRKREVENVDAVCKWSLGAQVRATAARKKKKGREGQGK